MEDQQLNGHPGGAPLLNGWLTRAEVAAGIGVCVDTLARWELRRIGPPCARIGRKILYRAEAVREWLAAREIQNFEHSKCREGEMTAGKTLQPRLLHVESEILGWIGQASRGDVLEYHRGFLALDRLRFGGRLRPEEADELSRVASIATDAEELGLVHLVQRRLGPDAFSYLMIGRDHKPGAMARLLEIKPHWPDEESDDEELADAA